MMNLFNKIININVLLPMNNTLLIETHIQDEVHQVCTNCISLNHEFGDHCYNCFDNDLNYANKKYTKGSQFKCFYK